MSLDTILSGVRDALSGNLVVFEWVVANILSSLFNLETRNIDLGLDLPGEQPALSVQSGGIRMLYVHRLLAAGWLVPNSAIR